MLVMGWTVYTPARVFLKLLTGPLFRLRADIHWFLDGRKQLSTARFRYNHRLRQTSMPAKLGKGGS